MRAGRSATMLSAFTSSATLPYYMGKTGPIIPNGRPHPVVPLGKAAYLRHNQTALPPDVLTIAAVFLSAKELPLALL